MANCKDCLHSEACKKILIAAFPYVPAEEIEKVSCRESDCKTFKPAADVVEVKHGRWITRNKGQNNWCECSVCNTVGSPFWKCCPMCEAKMDGGAE